MLAATTALDIDFLTSHVLEIVSQPNSARFPRIQLVAISMSLGGNALPVANCSSWQIASFVSTEASQRGASLLAHVRGDMQVCQKPREQGGSEMANRGRIRGTSWPCTNGGQVMPSDHRVDFVSFCTQGPSYNSFTAPILRSTMIL